MENCVCPVCGANVEGLVNRCDCCGAALVSKEPFLFISVVAWRTSAAILMDLLYPVEKAFQEFYGDAVFSDALDQIGIIPLCFPQELHADPEIARERRYVSLKNRYADLRLHISYEELIQADQTARLRLCAENIASAAAYVSKKDKTFRKEEFLNAVSDCVFRIYGI